jgi:hypothetical protein
MYRKGVIARKEERERKKKVKELQAVKQEVPPILLVSIPDPEKTWLAEQEEMKLQLQLQQQEEGEEVTFITDTVGDQSLQQDYIPFVGVKSDGDDNSSMSESEDSSLYDSDKDYSWHRRHREY